MLRRAWAISLGRSNGYPLALLALATVLLTATACATIAKPSGWSGPLIVDGTLLVNLRGQLLAIQMEDSAFKELWRFPAKDFKEDKDINPQGIYGTPVVANGVVYFGAYDGDVYALDLAKGRPVWDKPFATDGPVVGGVALGQDALYAGSDDGTLYAIDPNSGSETDRFDAGDSIWAPPLVADGVVYVATLGGRLYALDASTLDPLWDKPFRAEAGLVATPVLAGETIIVGGIDRRLYAIDAGTGSELWSFKADNWFWTQPLVAEGIVYAGSLDGNVYALNLATGEPVWDKPFAALSPIRAAPILVDDVLVVADRSGNLYGLNPATGDLRWGSLNVPITLGGDVLGHPIILGDKVLFTSQGGGLFRINPQNGSSQRVLVQAS